MANNTKTPVMVLQELSVKRCKSAPEYSIIYSKEGTHQNEFHMQVSLDEICAVGVGRSKQIAKHEAAQKALEKLEILGIYVPGHTVIKAPGLDDMNSPIKLAVNAIGVLSEICVENKIPMPEFTQISEVGPPHCKEFTYQCKVASILTRATAGTKKQAKQMAAKDMLDRIIQALPDIVAEFGDCPTAGLALTENESVVVNTYNNLSKFVRARPNLSIKVKDYHCSMINNIMEKEINLTDLDEFFNRPETAENLQELSEKMDLQMAIEIVEQKPFIVAVKLNSEMPFVTLGLSTKFETASELAIKQAFEYLKVLLKRETSSSNG